MSQIKDEPNVLPPKKEILKKVGNGTEKPSPNGKTAPKPNSPNSVLVTFEGQSKIDSLLKGTCNISCKDEASVVKCQIGIGSVLKQSSASTVDPSNALNRLREFNRKKVALINSKFVSSSARAKFARRFKSRSRTKKDKRKKKRKNRNYKRTSGKTGKRV